MRFATAWGDSIDVLRTHPDASFDSCVTDPEYGLSEQRAEDIVACLTAWLAGGEYEHGRTGFMGRKWDSFVPGPALWREVFRVLKPGAHLLCFAGTRTLDLMSIAIRLAGFEMRDTIGCDGVLRWTYGTGFPKSLNVSMSLDKIARGSPQGTADPLKRGRGENPERSALGMGGATGKAVTGWTDGYGPRASVTDEARQWEGWGTALKPAWEPILVFRRPLQGTVAANVLRHGTGALNIAACRVATSDDLNGGAYAANGAERHDGAENWRFKRTGDAGGFQPHPGRWPPNTVLCHLPGCRQEGMREVGVAGPKAADVGRGSGPNLGHDTYFRNLGSKITSGYASPDGTETVPAWSCVEGCPVAMLDAQAGERPGVQAGGSRDMGDTGSASRFFPQFLYCAKAPKRERWGWCATCGEAFPTSAPHPHKLVGHPTVKPLKLIQWLVRLCTPPGGRVLDPRMGTGTTLIAAAQEGFQAAGIDKEEAHVGIARARLLAALDALAGEVHDGEEPEEVDESESESELLEAAP